jgi:molybdate transport system substrate-binding protein
VAQSFGLSDNAVRPMRRFLLLLVFFCLAGCGRAPVPESVIVYAASSLTTALDRLVPVLKAEQGIEMVPVYGASSTMARQIEQGAPAGIFISADQDWMQYLSDLSLIERSTRVDLLTNRLVVIAPAAHGEPVDVVDASAWLARLGEGRLATADPSGVPAGKYARQALASLAVWNGVADRLAPGENVRATLQLVARGETPLGIVYHTDALAEPSVAIVATLPSDTHSPIVYPAALTTSASPRARQVLAFLQGARAQIVFEELGFGTEIKRS